MKPNKLIDKIIILVNFISVNIYIFLFPSNFCGLRHFPRTKNQDGLPLL